MSVFSANSDSPAAQDALAVVTRLREAGHVAYLAGGCVRDLLLGLNPKDYDIATDAPPDRVRSLFSHTQSVGAAFGVILVRHRRSMIEVATFRAEGAYLDGRRPTGVRFTSAEEDAQRRDFTINGLFLDPIEDRIIDLVGGQEDLRARRLRAIGDPNERFAEDHLRLLRAVRFAARFGLEMDPATSAAIRSEAPSLARISPERIAGELRHMLIPPTRGIAWRSLWRHRLADVIFRMIPGADAPVAAGESSLVRQLPTDRPVCFAAALAAAALDYRRDAHAPDADLAALLENRDIRAVVQGLRKLLKISNEESGLLEQILRSLSMLLADRMPGVASMKRFLAAPASGAARDLLEAARRAGVRPERIESLQSRLNELSREEIAPTPLITGDDLTAAGLRPGPLFKRVLEAAYDAQLEGRITTRQEAMRFAMTFTADDPTSAS